MHQHFPFLSFGATAPQWARASSFTRLLDHTQRRTTVGRTPLDEWSDRRRDLYLTTHNTYNRQISMPLVGFELTISASVRPKTYALDRVASGTGNEPALPFIYWQQNYFQHISFTFLVYKELAEITVPREAHHFFPYCCHNLRATKRTISSMWH